MSQLLDRLASMPLEDITPELLKTALRQLKHESATARHKPQSQSSSAAPESPVAKVPPTGGEDPGSFHPPTPMRGEQLEDFHPPTPMSGETREGFHPPAPMRGEELEGFHPPTPMRGEQLEDFHPPTPMNTDNDDWWPLSQITPAELAANMRKMREEMSPAAVLAKSGGRREFFYPNLRGKLCVLLALGLSPHEAAVWADSHEPIVSSMLEQDLEFAADLERTTVLARLYPLLRVYMTSADSWRAAQWLHRFLRRRRGEASPLEMLAEMPKLFNKFRQGLYTDEQHNQEFHQTYPVLRDLRFARKCPNRERESVEGRKGHRGFFTHRL